MSKTRRAAKKFPRPAKTAKASGQTFTDRDLKSVSPLTEQFEPTDASPIRQHHRMGGIS